MLLLCCVKLTDWINELQAASLLLTRYIILKQDESSRRTMNFINFIKRQISQNYSKT